MSQDTKNSGSFLGGLLFGVAAGAAGYFLFRTKDGEKAREKMNNRWEEIKKDLAKKGVITNKDASLPEMVGDIVENIVEPKKKKSASKRTYTKKKTMKKFQGTKKSS